MIITLLHEYEAGVKNTWNFLLVFFESGCNAIRQLHVFRHNRNAFGVNGSQIGVFVERDQIRLGRLLQSAKSGGLEAQIVFGVLSNFANQALKRQLANQKFCSLLILSDLAQRHCSRSKTVRLLDSSRRRSPLSRSGRDTPTRL